MCRFMLGRAGEGELDLGKAADLARQVGDRALEREAMSTRLRPIAWGPTHAADGAEYCSMVIDSQTANVAEKAHALQVRGLCEAMQGDVEGARTSTLRAWGLIEEFGLTLQRSVYAMDVGSAEGLLGDLDRAEHELRKGHDLLVDIGDTGARCTVDAMLADVLVRAGRYDEAAELAMESRAIAAADDLDAQPRWRAALARVLSRRGEHVRAEELAREAVGLVDPIDLLLVKGTVYDAFAEVLAGAGRTDEALAAVEQAIAVHEQKGNVVSAERSRTVLDELRAARPS